jgi:hypothetical protein
MFRNEAHNLSAQKAYLIIQKENQITKISPCMQENSSYKT